MSFETITVDAAALRSVLQSLIGNPHEIRELQMMYSSKVIMDDPINKLLFEFNEAVAADNAKVDGEGE